jgi:hypothetical protein
MDRFSGICRSLCLCVVGSAKRIVHYAKTHIRRREKGLAQNIHALSPYCFSVSFFLDQNWWIWERILLPTARLVRWEMTCSTGKRQLWDRTSLHTPVAYSFWIFTFLPTTHSSLPRFISRHVSTTAISTAMEEFVLIFSRISGARH